MTRLDLRPNLLSSQHNESSWLARVVWPIRTKTRQLFFFGKRGES